MSDITRKAIADALKRLLMEKPLSRVTVMDIAAECGISRMTFYYHFRDIYDLVGWIISSDIAIILSGRKTHDTWQDGFLSVFQAVEKNHVFVFNVYNSMSREQLERSLTGPVTELLLSVLKEATVQKKLKDDEMFFIASFYSYAFIGVMLDWIGSGMREKPELMIKRIECVMAGSFENAAGRFSSLQ
ncbi:MAG: TetR/AcrR family transcriptional regulator [Spirochaetes bacterium]|uniref:TetR/AcrR family transcriptional regulator n=1 Tax=Candidatus Ornithospirochaeta stercoripullorum TaxID=2840899 RepID=A0A9D9H5B4_9SPIO|nr:TetR/AcrR family transcriptional regulator [Candidatus Ornithospirochaeta stercoripullorum]